MVILADFSDTQFLMTCKRCEQTLQEGDRFCRYCGQDQLEGDSAAVIDITQPASNGDTVAPTDAAALRSARRDAWRQVVPGNGEAQPQNGASDGRPGGSVAPRRWSIGVAIIVVLGLAAALLYELYLGRQEEAAQPAISAQESAPTQAPASPAASIESPAAPVAPAISPPSDTPTPTAPAAIAPTPTPVPTPAPEPSPPPPVATAPPAAEPTGQNTCPDALAAMALCTKR
ncbi:MAG: hypothetical protein JSS14_17830 [Proteobacteria bacterium]|nr:hypothetical protein [Pseudomonadota bacterium]